jgi:hypothetical protein
VTIGERFRRAIGFVDDIDQMHAIMRYAHSRVSFTPAGVSIALGIDRFEAGFLISQLAWYGCIKVSGGKWWSASNIGYRAVETVR